MKILYITTIGGTMRFFQPFIRELIDHGHSVDIACSQPERVRDCYREWGCKIYRISTSRSPLNKGNLTAIKQIRSIVRENGYDIVHCHTPIAAACTRLACKPLRKNGVKVVYTAHGFHFYQGAPLKNWLLFYPMEKLCARWTDALITINSEDFALAKKKLRAESIDYVPGVGVTVEKISEITVDRAAKRAEIGVPGDAFMLLSVGELNENKNHETVIRALAALKDDTIHYVIAGKGAKRDKLAGLAKELKVNLHLLDFRHDITELDKAADVFVLPSFREGLNVSTMEAMASGLPVICGRIRGNTDLIDTNGGILFDPHSMTQCTEAIKTIRSSDRAQMGKYNAEKVKGFETERVHALVSEIYRKLTQPRGEVSI